MSASDTTMPLISAPWLNAEGNPLSVIPLPGLREEVIQSLECSYPGILSPPMKELLSRSCGLARTELGSIDFTGCWFLEEPYAIFRPALTLAIDDAERRWIAEVGNGDLPGPIWCVFPHPEVAVWVSDDLATFLATFRERTCQGEVSCWLGELAAQARAVWSQRHAWAIRPHEAHRSDPGIRGWLMTLPAGAYVYDLRARSAVRGWPYGVAGPSGRHYRCGRLLVFAVAGLPAEGWRASRRRARVAHAKAPATMPATEDVSFAIETARSRRKPAIQREIPVAWTGGRRALERGGWRSGFHGMPAARRELRSCG
jgi:hypothetical protein